MIPPANYIEMYSLGERPGAVELSAFVGTLPPVNRELLRQLVVHLQQHVSGDASDATAQLKMLGLMFAPTLIRHNDPTDMMKHHMADEAFTRSLLAHLPFDGDEHTERMLAVLANTTLSISSMKSVSARKLRMQAHAHRAASAEARAEHADHLEDHAALDAELAHVHAQIDAHGQGV